MNITTTTFDTEQTQEGQKGQILRGSHTLHQIRDKSLYADTNGVQNDAQLFTKS